MRIQIMGIKGDAGFSDIVRHFEQLGGDAVILDADMVCGRDHLLSAVMHAERAFENGTNRSKTILTETILYAAGDRQIGRATEAMRPKKNAGGAVAVLFGIEEPMLEAICMARCDSLIEASPEKAKNIGAEMFAGVSCEDAVLEHVAAVDLLKQ
ncbi:MAG: hypothetical protein LBJ20_04070 [Candidatus Methanoplasma sp.]|jgi:KEOPS complex subunit Cgi121|nr:hypothetical protein [Candidatus Methanoplasma sp.]